MKKTINWKLATICPIAALILAGCENRYTNTIEDTTKNKILIKDVKDGTQRILVFDDIVDNKKLRDLVTYAHYGDTIVVIQDAGCFDNYKTNRILKVNDHYVKFDDSAIYQRQQQKQFDSMRSAMLREKQDKQR